MIGSDRADLDAAPGFIVGIFIGRACAYTCLRAILCIESRDGWAFWDASPGDVICKVARLASRHTGLGDWISEKIGACGATRYADSSGVETEEPYWAAGGEDAETSGVIGIESSGEAGAHTDSRTHVSVPQSGDGAVGHTGLRDYISKVARRALSDTSLRDWVGELGGIGTSLHALPVQLIPISALLCHRTRLHALATELVGIGEIGGCMGALSSTEVVIGIGVVVVSEGAGGSAGIVGDRSIESVWTLSHTGVVGEQGESAVGTEFDACPVFSLPSWHIRVLIDGSSALGHAFLQRLINVGVIKGCALQLAIGSGGVCRVWVGTAVHASSNWFGDIPIKPIHLGGVDAVIHASLGVGVGKCAFSTCFHAGLWRNTGISE